MSVFILLLVIFVGLNAMKKRPTRKYDKQRTTKTVKDIKKKHEKEKKIEEQATKELIQVLQSRDLTEEKVFRRIQKLLEAGACVDCGDVTPICSAASRGWINVLRFLLAKLRKDYKDDEQKYLDLFCKNGGYGPLYWAICGKSENRFKCVLEILKLLELIRFETLIRAVLQNSYSHHRFRDKNKITLIELAEIENAGEKVIGLLVDYFALHEITIKQEE